MKEHSPSFDVCIVCALYEEASAVIDEFSARCAVSFVDILSHLGRYVYRHATIQNKYGESLTILVAWLPDSGPLQAGLNLQSIMYEFRPRFAAMTGFCAGDKEKVKLGDLVIAEYAYHYEAGKIIGGLDGQTIHLLETRTANPTSRVIQYAKGFEDWKKPVREMKRRLFASLEVEHANELKRVIGVMASGTPVRGDNPFPWLRETYNRNTVALDMEAATFYDALHDFPNTHALVVKGVCDYADMSKNDMYHDYAAHASAVYLLTFIQENVTEHTMPPFPDQPGSSPPFKVPAPRVFVAYAPEDRDVMERLQRDMATSGLELWSLEREQFSLDLRRYTEARDAMRKASAVLLIASPAAASSHAIKAQMDLAADYQRPIIVIWAKGEEWDSSNPGGWRAEEVLDARANSYETARATLIARVKQYVETVPPSPEHSRRPAEPRNPYKGLRAFTADDIRDFFGREALIDELANTLEQIVVQEQQGKQTARLLTVLGASGSGKSSVVLAGLLPCLKRGVVFDSQEWIYLDPVIPGTNPLEALAVSLAQQPLLEDVVSLSRTLASDSFRTLHLLTRQLVSSSRRKVLLFIDQFEEVFTLTDSEEERQHFFDLLITAVTEPHGPLLVILTLRADFYNHSMQYPALHRLLDAHHVAVFPMEREDLRRVIEQPAQLDDVQVTFEKDLVGDLLFAMRGQVGALPLLQFALDQLFVHRNGHEITQQAYREIGGIKGALARHAESTHANLPSDAHRKLARALFLRLIDPGLTDQDTTRRRAALAEFALPDPTQATMLRETIDAFITTRLLTTDEIAGIMTIEVSHEALIREWPRLTDWLRQAREDVHLQQIISEDAAQWQQRSQPKDRLYRGSQLKEALKWAKENIPSQNEAAFLRTSERRRVRYLMNIIGIALILLSAIGFAGLFYSQRAADPTHVTNLHDSGPGSLRLAIDTSPAGSTITFEPSLSGTILLTYSGLSFSRNLTIRGPGAHQLAISGGRSGYGIHVAQGITVQIFGLAFRDSMLKDNSFLYNEGILALTNCIISGNSSSGTTGVAGGIFNTGTLTLTDSIVSHNSSSNTEGGGGIFSTGPLTIDKSTIEDNMTTGDGGGINFNGGIGVVPEVTMAIDNSTISGNIAEASGGGIANSGKMVMTNSTVSDNTAHLGSGGGINDGEMTLTKSTISGNSAGQGGGIYSTYTITLTDTTVTGNSAMATGPLAKLANGGGINNFGDPLGFTNNTGKLTLTNSTVSDNFTSGSGGGIYNNTHSTLKLVNSTISENTANQGGGIDNIGSTILTFSTIYGNTAMKDGGGIANVTNPTAILPGTSSLKISDSLVAGNSAQIHPDMEGQFISNGYNLFQDASGSSFVKQPTDLLGGSLKDLDIDPVLRKNGGFTPTHALLSGSPAIDKIPLSVCLASGIRTDQRGVKRPQGPACDIGAYEYAP